MRTLIDTDQILADMTPIDDKTGKPCAPVSDMWTCSVCRKSARRGTKGWRSKVARCSSVALCKKCRPEDLSDDERQFLLGKEQ